MKRVLREPIVHFLGAGLVLFGLSSALGRTDANAAEVIHVNRDALLEFIQLRQNAFNREKAEAQLAALSDQELSRLIDDYIRDEALYREAITLGLAEGDYIVRERLVQKMEFIWEGFADSSVEPDRGALEEYFEMHRARYRVGPYLTFSHVFFESESRSRDEARAAAERMRTELNQNRTPSEEASKRGDPFRYHVNYFNRTPEVVASDFGEPMTKAIFELEPNPLEWQGPFDSPYGVHLVLVTSKVPAREAELSSIEARVREDWRRSMREQERKNAIAKLVDAYEVRLVYERGVGIGDDAASRGEP